MVILRREEGASLERDRKVYFAYVLLSLKDGTHYYGSTSDLEKRVRDHNSGKAKFTKGHRPFTLLYSETFATKAEASKRERFFKSISGYVWLCRHGVIKQNEHLERWPSGFPSKVFHWRDSHSGYTQEGGRC